MTEDAVKSILSGNIRHLRLMKDLSQQELAEKTNISVPFLSALERGEKFPSAESLGKLSEALEVSLAELKLKVFPYGKIGNYLYSQLENIYKTEYNPFFLLRSGENWTLGDNSLIFALIINQYRDFITYRKAPKINDNGLYEGSSSKKMIKVFTDIDVRFTLEDFFSKLALVYKD